VQQEIPFFAVILDFGPLCILLGFRPIMEVGNRTKLGVGNSKAGLYFV